MVLLQAYLSPVPTSSVAFGIVVCSRASGDMSLSGYSVLQDVDFFAATPIASEQRQAQTNVELLQTSSATSFRKISKTERESAGIGIWRLAVGQESGLSILSQIVCAIFNLTIIQHAGGFSIKMLVVR